MGDYTKGYRTLTVDLETYKMLEEKGYKITMLPEDFIAEL